VRSQETGDACDVSEQLAIVVSTGVEIVVAEPAPLCCFAVVQTRLRSWSWIGTPFTF